MPLFFGILTYILLRGLRGLASQCAKQRPAKKVEKPL